MSAEFPRPFEDMRVMAIVPNDDEPLEAAYAVATARAGHKAEITSMGYVCAGERGQHVGIRLHQLTRNAWRAIKDEAPHEITIRQTGEPLDMAFSPADVEASIAAFGVLIAVASLAGGRVDIMFAETWARLRASSAAAREGAIAFDEWIASGRVSADEKYREATRQATMLAVYVVDGFLRERSDKEERAQREHTGH